MNENLETLLGSLQQANSHNDLQNSVTSLRDLYDVDHVIYHSVNSTGQQYAGLTYSPEWVDRYLEKDYARIDPVVQGCYQRFHPVDWKQLDWSSKAARSFHCEAIDAGVGNQGLSVPIRGPSGQFALFTVSAIANDQNWQGFTRKNLSDLLLVAHFVNQKALELENGSDIQPHKNLSPREIDALCLLAAGYSRAQAAESLKISEHTLRVYIEAARFKMGAQNTTHAVALAITRGLIVV
ncbi:MAG: helix-turn-helix transcriptional regulator [Mangrovicoccus sp.]